MALIPCPACERMISREAVACPQCGHPNRSAEPAELDFTGDGRRPAGPTCYACSSAATTKCQGCGAVSCVLHVNPVYVPHGRGGANELRCDKCRESLFMWKVIGYSLLGIVVVGMMMFFFSQKAAFDAKWNNNNFPEFKK